MSECKCLDEFSAWLRKTKGATNVNFPNMDIFTGTVVIDVMYSLPGKKREQKTVLMGQYCPVCGKKNERRGPFAEDSPHA